MAADVDSPAGSGGAAGSDGPAAADPGAHLIDGHLSNSPAGYVKSTAPRFAGVATLGLICHYSGGKQVAASCHLHPKCAVKLGVVNEGVYFDRLAQWLALGTPCPGEPKERRLEHGRRHRELWCRYGPLPPMPP